MQLENSKAKNLLQVCWELNANNEEREINGLLEAMCYFKRTKGTIITGNQQDTIYHGDLEIEVVPAWRFLLPEAAPALNLWKK